MIPTRLYRSACRADAFYTRGNAYRAKGQHDRAIQDYDQTIRVNPQYAAAFFNRGLAKKAKGAAADIAKARQLQPSIGQ
jgi:tetratricopeptide (TPR) repeat protein